MKLDWSKLQLRDGFIEEQHPDATGSREHAGVHSPDVTVRTRYLDYRVGGIARPFQIQPVEITTRQCVVVNICTFTSLWCMCSKCCFLVSFVLAELTIWMKKMALIGYMLGFMISPYAHTKDGDVCNAYYSLSIVVRTVTYSWFLWTYAFVCFCLCARSVGMRTMRLAAIVTFVLVMGTAIIVFRELEGIRCHGSGCFANGFGWGPSFLSQITASVLYVDPQHFYFAWIAIADLVMIIGITVPGMTFGEKYKPRQPCLAISLLLLMTLTVLLRLYTARLKFTGAEPQIHVTN